MTDVYTIIRPSCWGSKVVHQHGGPILGSVNFEQYISTNIWSLGKRTDLKLGQVSSLPVSYNITISWLYPRNGFRFIFTLRDSASQELCWKQRNSFIDSSSSFVLGKIVVAKYCLQVLLLLSRICTFSVCRFFVNDKWCDVTQIMFKCRLIDL